MKIAASQFREQVAVGDLGHRFGATRRAELLVHAAFSSTSDVASVADSIRKLGRRYAEQSVVAGAFE